MRNQPSGLRRQGALRQAGVRSLVVVLPVLFALGAIGCNPDLLIRVTTRVFEDGSAHRRVEVSGRNSDGTVPTDPGWMLAEAALQLADPRGWKHVEEAPGRIVAEGTFPSVEAIPGTIAHGESSGAASANAPRADRDRISLVREDFVVLTRWTWREQYGDPFGRQDRAAAVAGLVDLAAGIVRDELHRTFGPGFETSAGEALVRSEAKSLFEELLAVREKAPGAARLVQREELWRGVLARHGVPLAPPARLPDAPAARVPGASAVRLPGAAPAGAAGEPSSLAAGNPGAPGFWEAETPLLLAWARVRLAAAIATPDRPIGPADLSFWPDDPEDEAAIRLIAEHASGSEDSFMSALDPLIGALEGVYGSGRAQHRFEFRLTPPGRLLRTNGAPDEGSILWLLRDEDLEARDSLLEAESFELHDDVLRGLGARRDLSTRSIVAIVDLLAERDPRGELRDLLRAAVKAGSLKPLRNTDDLVPDLQPRARELADLLDPSVPIREEA